MVFEGLLAQKIRLRDHNIGMIHLDNAGEFTSQAFNEYCVLIGIHFEHHVAHVLSLNGLAESFIKRLQLVAKPLIMKMNLPTTTWGHAIVHVAALVYIIPTSYYKFSPLQLASGREPNISHLRSFGCAVHVHVAQP